MLRSLFVLDIVLIPQPPPLPLPPVVSVSVPLPAADPAGIAGAASPPAPVPVPVPVPGGGGSGGIMGSGVGSIVGRTASRECIRAQPNSGARGSKQQGVVLCVCECVLCIEK